MGIIEVQEDGIYYVMSDPYQNGRMIFQSHLIITKEAFIEAYNKYIKEENHVDTDTEQTEDDK